MTYASKLQFGRWAVLMFACLDILGTDLLDLIVCFPLSSPSVQSHCVWRRRMDARKLP